MNTINDVTKYYQDKYGKMTYGKFTIKVIGGRYFGKKFKCEYGLFDNCDNLLDKNISIEKLKELASKKQKEN